MLAEDIESKGEEAEVLDPRERARQLESVRLYLVQDLIGENPYDIEGVAKRISKHVGLDQETTKFRIQDVMDKDTHFVGGIGRNNEFTIRYVKDPKQKIASVSSDWTDI